MGRGLMPAGKDQQATYRSLSASRMKQVEGADLSIFPCACASSFESERRSRSKV